MGAGDRYLEPRFTVPMSGKGEWPFAARNTRSTKRRLAAQGAPACARCGATGITGPHDDVRDEGRPTVRVCFGRTT